MKRKAVYILTGSIVIIGCIIVSLFLLQPKGDIPLADLTADSINSIEINAYPPDDIKVINDREEIERIVSVMQEIVTYKQVKSNDFTGQMVVYTLMMTDGTTQDIAVITPLVRIEGQYYKTKYAPAEELNRIYQAME